MKRFYIRAILIACLALISAALVAQSKPLFSVPLQLIDNRPFIEVKLNGHTFHFILDCGGNYGMDLQTARALGLKLNDPGTETGAGAGPAKIWHTTVSKTGIGTVIIPNVNFLVMDLSEIKNKLHLPFFDGIIGYSFMKNYAVQFDYPKSRVNFYADYTGPSPVRFSFQYGSIPKIRIRVDGIDATVTLDTGDRTAFTLVSHFAAQNGIDKNYELTDTVVTGYGLGGPVYARRFTLKQIKIGNILVKDIPSRMSTAKTGGFADTSIDGSIGGSILKQYKFTIDYKHNEIYFE